MAQERRGQEQRPDEAIIGAGQVIPVQRFSSLPPSAETTGDIESMSPLAGQAVGLVPEVKPAAQIVGELVEQARQIIEQRLQRVVIPSQGC